MFYENLPRKYKIMSYFSFTGNFHVIYNLPLFLFHYVYDTVHQFKWFPISIVAIQKWSKLVFFCVKSDNFQLKFLGVSAWYMINIICTMVYINCTWAVNCLLQGIHVKFDPLYQGILGSELPSAPGLAGLPSLIGINWVP